MPLTVLELYILSLIDRGLGTKYDLQRQGGVSLGSSSPALKKMQLSKLVAQDTVGEPGRRARHGLKITALGKRTVRQGWQALLADTGAVDLDSIFRIVDMADHYGATTSQIHRFLKAAALDRSNRGTASRSKTLTPRQTVVDLQELWRTTQVRAEAALLIKLADQRAPAVRKASTNLPAAKTTRKKMPR